MPDIAQDASLELQNAMVAKLRADPILVSLGARIYDRPDPSATYPYAALGPVQVIPEKGIAYDGSDISIQWDAYTGGPDSVEIKQLSAAIRAALDGAEFVLSSHRLVDLVIETSDYLPEPDGIRRHGVLVFRARTEPL